MRDQAEFIQILLVEDDPADQKLTRISLDNNKVANKLYTVSSGEEALDFLYHRGDFAYSPPRPDLILLDLNMPGMGGQEVLKFIKKDENLKTIPVIVLTTSDAEEDIARSYKLHANGYIKKPVDIVGFQQVVQSIKSFWFVVAKLPPKE
ncbi:MAG: response regulator [Thermincola sp.]|nr:response regulator [Thermincola sp.]MDT3703008.1 response regulator [Thermincola sp.]